MVERCKIKKGCCIVDLDRTLLKGNSLKFLTLFLLTKLVKNLNFKLIFQLLYFIALRQFKLIPHKKMKYKIMKISHNVFSQKDYEIFAGKLMKNCNTKVIDILKDYFNRGEEILLATASPDFYLSFFVCLFDNLEIQFLGTKFTSTYENFIENYREEKLKSVELFLKINNLECVAVLTDHIDDLPLLLQYPQNIYLINPTRKTLSQIKTYPQICYQII